jgi:hypothetical protein
MFHEEIASRSNICVSTIANTTERGGSEQKRRRGRRG